MKKIISAILICITLTTLSASALAYSPTTEQLADLAKYKILTGDNEGDLHLEDNINRAEAAKIICTILNLAPSDSKESPFPDVSPGHWALGYIDMAKSLKIVSGDDKGNFRPFDPVTNEEYLKMLITALGYNPMAESRGGFPAGYITIAHTYGITKDMQFEVNIPAKRGDVAIMTYRAIDTPIMQQTGFGSQIEYIIMNGENNTELMTLRLELDPDFKYPEKETPEEPKKEDSEPDFAQSAYTYADIEIKNLKKEGDTYTFTDKKKSKSPNYIIDGSTYVHSDKNTLSLSEIKEGMIVRVLCIKISEGTVKVLGVEILKKA